MGPKVQWFSHGTTTPADGGFTEPVIIDIAGQQNAGSRVGGQITAMNAIGANLIVGATTHDGGGVETNVWTSFAGAGDVYTTIFNTQLSPGAGGFLRLLYKVNPATDPNWFASQGGVDVYSSIAAISFSGADPVGTLDNSQSLGGGLTLRTSWNAGNFTQLRNGCLLVAALLINANSISTAIAIDSGFQLRVAIPSNSNPPAALADVHSALALATKWSPFITTVNPTWTWTTANFACAGIASFRAAP